MTRAGYFYIGGRYQKLGDKTVMVGQMFVQSRSPARITQAYPVVMVHGLAQTGVNYLATADGRPGWVQRFVEKGYPVYVVDQVGRGRSGTNPEVYGPYDRLGTRSLERTHTAPEVYDLYPQAKLHTRWPGGAGVPGNAAFDQFFASQVPFLANSQQTEELVDPALLALLEKIGPAILITHGQAALFGWAASDARPDLVKAHVAVEPNGPPFFDVQFRGGKEFWEKTGDGRARAYGLTRMPLTFDPPAKAPEDLIVAQQAKGSDAKGAIRRGRRADPLLAAGRARPGPAEPREGADRGGDRGGLVPRHLRRVHHRLPDPGRRQARRGPAGRSGPPRQRPHDDAGDEQRRRGGRPGRLDRGPREVAPGRRAAGPVAAPPIRVEMATALVFRAKAACGRARLPVVRGWKDQVLQ